MYVEEHSVPANIGEPDASVSSAACGCGRQQRLPGRAAIHTSVLGWGAIVGSGRRRDTFCARPIGHIRMTVIALKAESDPLLGHVIESSRSIPGFEFVAGIFRKVWGIYRGGSGALALDGRTQH